MASINFQKHETQRISSEVSGAYFPPFGKDACLINYSDTSN